ncbi:MAG: YegP family protein [Bacteroidia bacterium]|nr:YegP family protein [Bacteroidia bacterium]
MKNPKYQLYKSGSEYRFRLKARNGEIILKSEGYTSKSSCLSGIESVKRNSPYDNRYERKISTNQKYYFVLKAANGEIIGVSELYSSRQSREVGINSVKLVAPSAPIEDLTLAIF